MHYFYIMSNNKKILQQKKDMEKIMLNEVKKVNRNYLAQCTEY